MTRRAAFAARVYNTFCKNIPAAEPRGSQIIITYRAGYKIILTEQVLKSILIALVVVGM